MVISEIAGDFSGGVVLHRVAKLVWTMLSSLKNHL